MPRFGLGTGMLSNAEAIKHAIVDVGYRHIDAAAIMKNEKTVGKGIRKALDSGKVTRDDFFVTTKLFHTGYEDPETDLDLSLEKLGLDYVDSYYVHWPSSFFTKAKLPMHEIWQSMEALMWTGKVRSLAVSNFNLTMTADLLTYAHEKPVANQICLNPQCAQDDLVRFLMDNDVVPVGYSPLGRVGSNMGPVGDDIKQDEMITSLAAKYNCTPSQILLSWGLSRGYCIVPKAKQHEHQIENWAAQDIELTKDEIKGIIDKFDERKMLYQGTYDIPYNLFA